MRSLGNSLWQLQGGVSADGVSGVNEGEGRRLARHRCPARGKLLDSRLCSWLCTWLAVVLGRKRVAESSGEYLATQTASGQGRKADEATLCI